MTEVIVISVFFNIIAAFLYLLYLGNKKNPMTISATADIMKINEDIEKMNNLKINKMKITAVEWLTIQLERYYGHADIKNTTAFLRAMEMEKQQIIDAFNMGMEEFANDTTIQVYQGEQYYNETFKNK